MFKIVLLIFQISIFNTRAHITKSQNNNLKRLLYGTLNASYNCTFSYVILVPTTTECIPSTKFCSWKGELWNGIKSKMCFIIYLTEHTRHNDKPLNYNLGIRYLYGTFLTDKWIADWIFDYYFINKCSNLSNKMDSWMRWLIWTFYMNNTLDYSHSVT